MAEKRKYTRSNCILGATFNYSAIERTSYRTNDPVTEAVIPGGASPSFGSGGEPSGGEGAEKVRLMSAL